MEHFTFVPYIVISTETLIFSFWYNKGFPAKTLKLHQLCYHKLIKLVDSDVYLENFIKLFALLTFWWLELFNTAVI